MKKYYDEEFGWGEIIAEEEDEVLVRFDGDPWYPTWCPKRE